MKGVKTSITKEEERFSDLVYVAFASAIPRPVEENIIFVSALLEVKSTTWIVDAGCGPGETSAQLLKWGNVIGIDISRKVLRMAQVGCPKASFVRGDLLNLPIRDESVDVVVFWDSLHHLADLGQAIEHSFRVLKPGGCLFAFEPNIHSYQLIVFKCFYGNSLKSSHERALSPFRLKALFLSAGFSPVLVRVVGIVPQRLYAKFGKIASRVFCQINWTFSKIPLLSLFGGRMCIYAVKKQLLEQAVLA